MFENKSQKSFAPIVRYRKITQKNTEIFFEEILKDDFISNKVISYLSIFDNNYAGFQVKDFKDTVLFHNLYQEVTEEFLSDGTRYFLKIAEQFANFSNGIVFIDPIDCQISPNSFPVLVKLLYHLASKRRLQLFLTTHSQELIDEWLDLLHFYHQLSVYQYCSSAIQA